MFKRLQSLMWTVLLPALLSACAGMATVSDGEESELAKPVLLGEWEHKTFPNKTATHYELVGDELNASSSSAMSVLRQSVELKPDELGEIEFSWRTQGTTGDADVGEASKDDSPARVVLVFDGDKSAFSAKDHMLSDLSRMLTGEPLPHATLAYVWSGKKHKAGEVVLNPRTSRIRNLVVDAGEQDAKTWRKHKRNIKQDYQKVFGEAPGRLLAVMLMSDTDNTKSHAKASYSRIQLLDSNGRLLRKLQ